MIRAFLQPVLCVFVGALAGAAAGALSWYAYVIGMVPLICGLAVGSAAAAFGLWVRGRTGHAAALSATLGVVVSLAAFHVTEDRHLVRAWLDDFAYSRLAASGAPPSTVVDDDELHAFWGEGADAALDEELLRQTGRTGAVGRTLLRADAGVRLLGPWHQGRGLALGRVGAVIWWLLEAALALALALTVTNRVGRAAGQPALENP